MKRIKKYKHLLQFVIGALSVEVAANGKRKQTICYYPIHSKNKNKT